VAPKLKRDNASRSLVVGVTKMAWMYGKSRDWAERLFQRWEDEQLAGTAPVRVFRQGKRDSLFTTIAILHATMPPGRDLVLYRRMSAVEAEVAQAHQRIDREILERKRADADLEREMRSRRAG
jgi:hypothetical protein